MPPRKSSARARPSQPSSIATSSRVTLDDIQPPSVPTSITWDYTNSGRPRAYLDEQEKERMMYELIGFYPRKLCDDITHAARDQIDMTIGSIENWATGRIGKSAESQRELDIGLYAAESLLESRVDKESDRLTAWLLRNPFDVKGDREYVLPWHENLDFGRGDFVMKLPEGQATLENRLEELRTKTEQARLVSQRLEQAEKAMDRRLEIAKQRKAEVGFVKEVLAGSELSPLDTTTGRILENLTRLHENLITLNPSPSNSTTGIKRVEKDTKAWEMGRQAYLNWAVGKLVNPSGTSTSSSLGASKSVGPGGDEFMEELEAEMKSSGGVLGVEKLSREV